MAIRLLGCGKRGLSVLLVTYSVGLISKHLNLTLRQVEHCESQCGGNSLLMLHCIIVICYRINPHPSGQSPNFDGRARRPNRAAGRVGRLHVC